MIWSIVFICFMSVELYNPDVAYSVPLTTNPGDNVVTMWSHYYDNVVTMWSHYYDNVVQCSDNVDTL